jgi:hypothetical protein
MGAVRSRRFAAPSENPLENRGAIVKTSLRAIYAVSVVSWAAACGGAPPGSESWGPAPQSVEVETDFGDTHAIAQQTWDGSIRATLFAASGRVAELHWNAETKIAKWEIFGQSAGTLGGHESPTLQTANLKVHDIWTATQEARKATAAAAKSPQPEGRFKPQDMTCSPDFSICCYTGGEVWACCSGTYCCNSDYCWS